MTTVTTAPLGELGDLAPIGLAELVDCAALLARVDRKYLLPAREVHALVAELPADTRVLEIDGHRDFGYRSIYLDTPRHDSYLAAGRSTRRRWKVRTRSYLDTGSSWLEVKTRAARKQTVKRRIEHPEAWPGTPLTPAGTVFVAGMLGDEATRIEPVLATAYRRTTLLLPASGTRATIDLELGWTSLTGINRDLDRPSMAIVETKTGATPSEVDRLLWSHGHRPRRLSKYGVGMAALHPDLPRLKWHRTLQQLGLPRAA